MKNSINWIHAIIAFAVMLVGVGALVEARVGNIERTIQMDIIEIRKRVDEIYILLIKRGTEIGNHLKLWALEESIRASAFRAVPSNAFAYFSNCFLIVVPHRVA